DEAAGGAGPYHCGWVVIGEQAGPLGEPGRAAQVEQLRDGVQVRAGDVRHREVRLQPAGGERVGLLGRVVGIDEPDRRCAGHDVPSSMASGGSASSGTGSGCAASGSTGGSIPSWNTPRSSSPGPTIGSPIRPRQAHTVSWLAVSTGLPRSRSSGAMMYSVGRVELEK